MGWFLTFFSLYLLVRHGISRSFFHQDDVVELGVVARWQGWSTLAHMNNEHLNITFWPLLYLQWLLFGINYSPYLIINVFLHILVLALIFTITFKQTKSLLWSSLPVWGMVINPNWFTVVWWITGQMFFLSTIFALLSYWILLKIQTNPNQKLLYFFLFVTSILPGLSWGVGLTWPIWLLLVYGLDYKTRSINLIGKVLIASQISLVLIYFPLSRATLSVHTDPRTWLSNPLAVVKFAIVGISNTVVGRWLWPVENLKIRVIALAAMALIFIFSKTIKKIFQRNILFGIIVTSGVFLTFAIPRWRFGIGHAMANYYAYFPLPFLLISLSIFFQKVIKSNSQKLIILLIFVLHIPMSWYGFEQWAGDWVIRPQQTRAYFSELNSVQKGECLENIYIPEYIVPQNIWHIDYLWPIFKKDFNPFCKGSQK